MDVDPDLREIRQAIILDHDERPRNCFRMLGATSATEAHNPLCGDRYRIYLRIADGVIAVAAFDGHGCAVSRASCSIMTTMLAGLSPVQADALANATIEYLTSGTFGDRESLGDLCAFEEIHRIPTRRQCALLAWTALRSAVASEVR